MIDQPDYLIQSEYTVCKYDMYNLCFSFLYSSTFNVGHLAICIVDFHFHQSNISLCYLYFDQVLRGSLLVAWQLRAHNTPLNCGRLFLNFGFRSD